MLNLLDVNKFTSNLTPVTTTELLTKTKQFHPDGLFSELIFGAVGTNNRDNKFSYIELNCIVVHPTALKILLRLDRRIMSFISTEKKFTLKDGVLIEDEIAGKTGISNFISFFPNVIFRGDTPDRTKLIDFVHKCYKSGTLFISRVPVIPPNLRPMFQDEEGTWTVDPINDFYITLIRRAVQARLSGNKSGELYDLINYSVQKAVIDHDEFVRTKIEKKSGIVRESMLSKRVDFSARAVITPNPSLKAKEIGIPFRDAVVIFEPLLIHQLLHGFVVSNEELSREIKSYTGLELSIETINRVIKSIKNVDKIPDRLYDIFFEATRRAMEGRVVISKRDPALHPQSVRGYYPVLIKGNTLEISSLVVGGHGADFDGDQMAVYHPLSNESQQQVKERMMRAESPEISSGVNFELSKEMCVGLYLLTKDIKSNKPEISVTDKDLENVIDLNVPVIYRKTKTTIGRAILNSCFPSNYPFINKTITKKSANQIVLDLVSKYGGDVAGDCASKMKDIGFKYATIIAPSITIDMIELPQEIYKLKKKLEGATTEEAIDLIAKMKSIMIKHLQGTGLSDLIESGSAKGWDQPIQILVTKGIISDPTGKILPVIKGSFSDGLTNTEYFQSASGARKGLMDRVLNTADTGYMSRKLAYVLNSVECDPYLTDCGSDKYLQLKLDKDIMKKIQGRYVLKGNHITLFDPDKYNIGDVINLRSPIYCRSYKICHTCYGKLIERNKTPYVGVLAAQTIGENGTQLIMRTFHTGGAVKLQKRNVINDIFDNQKSLSKSDIEKYFSQEEDQLFAMKNMKITIDLDDYTTDDYEIDEEFLSVKSLICIVSSEDITFDLILDYPVNIYCHNLNKTKEKIEVVFEEGDNVLKVPLEKTDLKELVRYVERMLIGKEIFKDTDHLFSKIYKVYGPISNYDIVHFEILLSQCLRSAKNISLPARMVEPWDPVLINLRKVVFSSGFLQGLAFENLNGAIEHMLIDEQKLPTSILEKVFTGQLVVKEED